jgi:hypothetical protein
MRRCHGDSTANPVRRDDDGIQRREGVIPARLSAAAYFAATILVDRRRNMNTSKMVLAIVFLGALAGAVSGCGGSTKHSSSGQVEKIKLKGEGRILTLLVIFCDCWMI